MSRRARVDEARRSQKRENLATLGKQKVSHRESSAWEEKAQRDFDRWFFAQSKDKQDVMREQGINPYREMGDPRRGLAPLFEKSYYFGYTQGDSAHTEAETFVSREKVAELVGRILATLAVSTSPEVRLHVELLKVALRTHDALNGEQLGKLYDLGRAGINYRVQRMREVLEGTPQKSENGQKRSQKKPNQSQTPSKESFLHPASSRVARHSDGFVRAPCKTSPSYKK